MSKQKILVTGGAGFIGSHMTKKLNQAGYETIAYDNLYSGKKESVKYGKFVEGDIGDRGHLDKIFSENSIDAVMHFAAYTDVEESMRDPEKYYRNNVANTLVLLEAMRAHNIHYIIFSSSAAIFGMPQAPKITEDHPKNPINPYGQSKLMVENMLRDYDAAYGFKYASFRYFNAAGGDPQKELKNLKERETNLIPVLLQNLKNNNVKTSIFGTDYPTKDGTCVRDFIHIIDLADAHIKAFEKLLNKEPSREYNLGNGKGFTVKEVLETAERITGKAINKQDAGRRTGDPDLLIADGSRAEKELNWYPKYSLDEMVDHAWSALF